MVISQNLGDKQFPYVKGIWVWHHSIKCQIITLETITATTTNTFTSKLEPMNFNQKKNYLETPEPNPFTAIFALQMMQMMSDSGFLSTPGDVPLKPKHIVTTLKSIIGEICVTKTTPLGKTYVDLKECRNAFKSCATRFDDLRKQIATDVNSKFLYSYFSGEEQKKLVTEIVEFLIKFFKRFVKLIVKNLSACEGKTLAYADELTLYESTISTDSVSKILGKIGTDISLRDRFGDLESFSRYCYSLFKCKMFKIVIDSHDLPIHQATEKFMKYCKLFVDRNPIPPKELSKPKTASQSQPSPSPQCVFQPPQFEPVAKPANSSPLQADLQKCQDCGRDHPNLKTHRYNKKGVANPFGHVCKIEIECGSPISDADIKVLSAKTHKPK